LVHDRVADAVDATPARPRLNGSGPGVPRERNSFMQAERYAEAADEFRSVA
jgi:hypothetical protein